MLVKGYDTSLNVDVIKSALTKHFSSCGEIVFVFVTCVGDGTLICRTASIYILGDGAEEKALQLSGSVMGGRKLVVTSATSGFIKLTPEMAARLAQARRVVRSKMIHVEGYDTSLPADELKSLLTNHFSSCGEITDLTLFSEENASIHASTSNHALIYILGEDAEEKALQLNGSDMGGCKLAVVPAYKPSEDRGPHAHIPVGYTLPAWCTNPRNKKKKKMNKKKKTGCIRKKTRK